METAIVFIIFNRPEQTKKVFESIRRARPKRLLVIADGPRHERDRTAETRAMIHVDWPCEVLTNYSEVNLGCKKRIATGLNWVFSNVERAIIIEDDCLPDPSFFRFCEEMLERYKDDTEVMHIGGNFFQQKNKSFTLTSSYYFSKIPHIWGWATWRRAWNLYDIHIEKWPDYKKNNTLKDRFKNIGAYEYWSAVWDQYYTNKIDSWDGQWFFACISHHGLCITPTKNLVTNIGFGADATHTKVDNGGAGIPLQEMLFPLTHPEKKAIDMYDDFTLRQNFGIDEKLFYRLVRPIKTHFPGFYQTVKDILQPFLRR